jgi:hypothetical protein
MFESMNDKNGQAHTAKIPTWICYIGGVLVGLGGFFQKLTGVSWEATTAFAVILFTIGGAGHAIMAKKNGG